MRCLMCGKQMGYTSLRDIFDGADPLCSLCRKGWRKDEVSFLFEGISAHASYLYNDAFMEALIQYKELGDEALKDVFLAEVRTRFRLRYTGYTILCMPSSQEKQNQRGFSHLARMFESTKLPVMEPFVKIEDSEQKHQGYYGRKRMEHGIALKEGVKLPHKILLADDTITTGSTLAGALHCLDLKQHDIRIYTVSYNRHLILKRCFDLKDRLFFGRPEIAKEGFIRYNNVAVKRKEEELWQISLPDS